MYARPLATAWLCIAPGMKPMTRRIRYSTLVDTDIDELAAAIYYEAVYEFIGGLPSRADFDLWLLYSYDEGDLVFRRSVA